MRLGFGQYLGLGVVALLPAQVLAQSSVNVAAIAAMPNVRAAIAALERDNAWTIDQQIALCEIPAPPFQEIVRARAFRDQLIALGVQRVRMDAEGNVIGEVRGTRPGPTILLSGHLDTVFPEGTDVRVKRAGTRLTAPGISDDCRGLAVTLAVTRTLLTSQIPFAGRVLIVGTVGEEGAGNLRGVRAIFRSAFKDSIDVFFSVDGTGSSITNGGVGSNRYRVHYSGPGGHSYEAFGMPSPIHALGRAIAKIADLEASMSPKVTFNVGVIAGGTSVNSIANESTMDIDLRSESAAALAVIDAKLRTALVQALNEERARWPQSQAPLTLKIDTIGIRAAGRTADTSLVVRTALAVSTAMHIQSPLVTSSTDANIAMSVGIPALMLPAGGTSHGEHSLQEWYDDGADGFKGPQWILLLLLTLTGVR